MFSIQLSFDYLSHFVFSIDLNSIIQDEFIPCRGLHELTPVFFQDLFSGDKFRFEIRHLREFWVWFIKLDAKNAKGRIQHKQSLLYLVSTLNLFFTLSNAQGPGLLGPITQGDTKLARQRQDRSV